MKLCDVMIDVEHITFFNGKKKWAANIPILSLIETAEAIGGNKGQPVQIQIRIRG